jgi:glutamate/tyrosine decarboxylase-like PLP-dependent enzyme
VWAALQSLGRDGIAELVERCCRRAQQFAELLIEVPGVEIANDVVLNQVVVRFPGRAGVVEAVQASGACVMTPTVWQGEPGMRISVSNWQTTEADVARSVAAIREVMARLQPTSST